MTTPVLSVRDLSVHFPTEAGVLEAVRGLNFDLYPEQSLSIVGESGSGKSVTALAIMGLLPDYAAVQGSITMDGQDLTQLDDPAMSHFRGNRIGMIFQDPLSALTPVFSVGDQIIEAIRCHQNVSKRQAETMAVELLDLVGIPDPPAPREVFPTRVFGWAAPAGGHGTRYCE